MNLASTVSGLCLDYFIHVSGGHVVECQTCDLDVADSVLTRGWCVPTPALHTIPEWSVLNSGEGLVPLIGAVVYLSYCTVSQVVRYHGQWMAA